MDRDSLSLHLSDILVSLKEVPELASSSNLVFSEHSHSEEGWVLSFLGWLGSSNYDVLSDLFNQWGIPHSG
jgi:hypothetical protein